MKKQLEKDIELVAPYEPALEERFLKKINKKPTFLYGVVLASFVLLAVAVVALSLQPIPNKQTIQLPTEPLTELPIVLSYEINGLVANDEPSHLSILKEAFNRVEWERDVKLEMNGEPDYMLQITGRRAMDQPIETWAFRLWHEKDGFKVIGDLGVGLMKEAEADSILTVIGGEEAKPAQIVQSPNAHTVVRYAIFDKYPVEQQVLLEPFQSLFAQIVWEPSVEKEWERHENIKMRLWIKDESGSESNRKDLYIWLNNRLIEFSGDFGYGRLEGKAAIEFEQLIRAELARNFPVREPRNAAEQATFQSIYSNIDLTRNYYINGARVEPDYVLNVDGELLYIFCCDEPEELGFVKAINMNKLYSNFQQADVIEVLQSITKADTDALFAGIDWQQGMVSMRRQFDETFVWQDVFYQLWYEENGEITIVPRDGQRWAKLDNMQSNLLRQVKRELQIE